LLLCITIWACDRDSAAAAAPDSAAAAALDSAAAAAPDSAAAAAPNSEKVEWKNKAGTDVVTLLVSGCASVHLNGLQMSHKGAGESFDEE
jgi:hypothetical protein